MLDTICKVSRKDVLVITGDFNSGMGNKQVQQDILTVCWETKITTRDLSAPLRRQIKATKQPCRIFHQRFP